VHIDIFCTYHVNKLIKFIKKIYEEIHTYSFDHTRSTYKISEFKILGFRQYLNPWLQFDVPNMVMARGPSP
jgi:cysteinyl-tRNA synthetase